MKFYDAVCKLSNIKRFPTYRMSREYNCAEHSYRVAMLSMLMVDEFNLNPKNTVKIDKAEVLSKALIHDLEESEINDIPSPIKKYPGLREMLRAASEEIMKRDILDSSLPNKLYYLKMWKEDKDHASGEIIELADKLEAYLAAKSEIQRGNQDFRGPFDALDLWLKSREGTRLMEKFPVAYKLSE